jgi:hypothetical protein
MAALVATTHIGKTSPGMRMIDPSELIPPDAFHAQREGLNVRASQDLALRRLALGPWHTLAFASRQHRLLQAQAAAIAANGAWPEAVARAVAAANRRIAPPGCLAACLDLAVDAGVETAAPPLSELAPCTYAEVEGLGRVFGVALDGAGCGAGPTPDTAKGVWLRFGFGADQLAALRLGAEFGFGIDHPRFRVGAMVKRALRAALLDDLY